MVSKKNAALDEFYAGTSIGAISRGRSALDQPRGMRGGHWIGHWFRLARVLAVDLWQNQRSTRISPRRSSITFAHPKFGAENKWAALLRFGKPGVHRGEFLTIRSGGLSFLAAGFLQSKHGLSLTGLELDCDYLMSDVVQRRGGLDSSWMTSAQYHNVARKTHAPLSPALRHRVAYRVESTWSAYC